MSSFKQRKIKKIKKRRKTKTKKEEEEGGGNTQEIPKKREREKRGRREEANVQPKKGKEKRKKKKKKKKGGNVPQHPKKKKKRVGRIPMCKSTWAFLSIKQSHFLLSFFSLIWGENFLVGQGRKHLTSPFIFLPPYPTKHISKIFPCHFLSKVFHPPYFTFKQTDPKGHA